MRQDPEQLDGYIVDQKFVDTLRAINERFAAAIGGMDPAELDRESKRLYRAGDYAGACRLYDSCDFEAIRLVSHDLAELPNRMRWFVAGVEVPPAVERSMWTAPRREWRRIMDTVAAAIRGLANAHLTPSPNPEPGLVRESSCPVWGWKGFSDEEATQCRADRGLASAG